MKLIRNPLTVEDLEKIKQLFDSGKTQAEVARQTGRVATVVRRVEKQIKSGKFLERLAEVQQREIALSKLGIPSTEQRRKRIIALRDKGLSNIEVAKKLGLKPGTTSYHYYDKYKPKKQTVSDRGKQIRALRDKGMGITEVAKKLGIPVNNASYHFYRNGQAKPNANNLLTDRIESAKRFNQIVTLNLQGLSPKQTAEKLGINRTTVHYYLAKARKQGKQQAQQIKESLNGTGSANGNGNVVNRNILIGVAYAETERFITVLGERLGLTAEILRPKLSELLGHSPFREASRHGN